MSADSDVPSAGAGIGRLIGLSGHWGAALPTTAMHWSAAVGLEVGTASAIDPAVKYSGGALAKVHGYSSSIHKGANPTGNIITQGLERSQSRHGESCELPTLNY